MKSTKILTLFLSGMLIINSSSICANAAVNKDLPSNANNKVVTTKKADHKEGKQTSEEKDNKPVKKGTNIKSNKTDKSSTQVNLVGNTQGNIANGGIIAQQGDWIYYAHIENDSNKLYKVKKDGTGRTKLCDDNVSSINVVGDWIYYLAPSGYFSTCLFKIKTDGTERTKLVDAIKRTIIADNQWIYFQESNCSLCKIKIGGTKIVNMTEESPELMDIWYGIRDYELEGVRHANHENEFLTAANGWIYFKSGYKRGKWELYKAKSDGTGVKKLSDDNVDFVNVVGNWIYYANISDDHCLYKVKTDGSSRRKLTDTGVYYVNVEGDWIYYLDYIKKPNGEGIEIRYENLNKIKTAGSKQESCIPSFQSQFNVLDGYIYYADVNSFFRSKPDGSESICFNGKAKVEHYWQLCEMISKNVEVEIVNDDKLKKAYEKAQKIISSIIKPNMSELQKEKAVHDYIVNNINYDFAGLREYFSDEELSKTWGESYNIADYTDENYNEKDGYSCYGGLVNGRASCGGYMKSTRLLMLMAGIECYEVVGKANNGYYIMGHGWNIVKVNGKYYHVDTTWDDPLYSDGRRILRHKYFNLSDEEMAKDHEWDREDYPECTD